MVDKLLRSPAPFSRYQLDEDRAVFRAPLFDMAVKRSLIFSFGPLSLCDHHAEAENPGGIGYYCDKNVETSSKTRA
ncbi:MAG TPA: hypothetical protein VKA60_00910 [Blastocatellia bacterium]|nr:hypothetical protein [Blastocatellia bacterium]